MKGKAISFAQPYGCSPADIRLLHLRIALYLYQLVEAELDKLERCKKKG